MITYSKSLTIDLIVRVYEVVCLSSAQGITRDEISHLLVPEDSHEQLIDQILTKGLDLEHLRLESDRYIYQSRPEIVAAYINTHPHFNHQ